MNQASPDDARDYEERPMQCVTTLRAAAQNGRLGAVRLLIKHKDIDLDMPGKTCEEFGFESPLQVARRYGHDAIVKVLLDAGAKDDDAGEEDHQEEG